MATKKKAGKSANKAKSRKVASGDVWTGTKWKVVCGSLARGRGRPVKTESLFHAFGEKLPYASLDDVVTQIETDGHSDNGVYMAHDSMGYARYVGRGDIFTRLKSHFKAHPDELTYFSFYIVKDKKHEREIETILLRAAGPQLYFNDRKKRIDIRPGDVRDFEAGTDFYERQSKRGKKPKKK